MSVLPPGLQRSLLRKSTRAWDMGLESGLDRPRTASASETLSSWFDSTREEKAALVDAIDEVKALIDQSHSPDGYNIGVDVGRPAGQTHFHMHLHVIPRYHGDARGEAGGVRFSTPAWQEPSQGVQLN